MSGPTMRSALDCPLAQAASVTQAVNSVVSGPISTSGSRVHVAAPAEQPPQHQDQGNGSEPTKEAHVPCIVALRIAFTVQRFRLETHCSASSRLAIMRSSTALFMW